jgi:dipeptidyl-peptidase 4
MRRSLAPGLRIRVAFAALGTLFPCNYLRAQVPSEDRSGVLTVKRIYSQPSLGGKLSRGVQWTPSGKMVSFFETKGAGKEAKSELWGLDAATGKRELLVGSEKLESLLPADKSGPTQATGLGRRAAPQYIWAPGGESILFVGSNALIWLDLKRQEARTLLSGKEPIADVKISPDGKSVSFVRGHNLFVIGVIDVKERAVTVGVSEGVRKGDLDWVYPVELDN